MSRFCTMHKTIMIAGPFISYDQAESAGMDFAKKFGVQTKDIRVLEI